MEVQAEVSLYPLRTQFLTEEIQHFVEHLRQNNLKIEMGTMSSHVSGDCQHVFRTLGEAFEKCARGGDIVLTAKVSNACPPRAKGNNKLNGNPCS